MGVLLWRVEQFDSVMGGFMTAGEGKWETSDREMGGGTVREGGAV